MSSEYLFPEAYVEGVEGYRKLCRVDNEYLVFTETRQLDLPRCIETYGLIPYEKSIEYIDLVNALVTKSIVILRQEDTSRDTYRGYLLRENTSVCLQEARGTHIVLQRREGDSVKSGDLLGYMISGKLEVRKILSHCEGLIALVIDMTWEEPRRVVLVITRDYESINARKAA